MGTAYARITARAARRIEEKGAEVNFLYAPDSYDPLTNVTTPGTPQIISGHAVEDQGDVDKLAVLGLIGQRNVTLIVANKFNDENGDPIAFVPEAPMQFVWTEITYTVRDVDDGVGPDGTPIIYIITGSV